ncbi:hypothetical protein FOV72_19710 [Gordonia rubripertincta]|uniref:hypothetical protein n=1 Tax=Gordonia rubripertincta TaxID=36822 RepID=UPI00117D6915|nr:hypothetical protein [Gordonia rubripertincta]TSD93489.1 hypothetical protein FOV72_19710 [Gordonia rubripertincta]
MARNAAALVLAEGKPLPSELQGIVTQLLGIATWAGIAICVASLLILIIMIQIRHRTSAENYDRLITGTIKVVAAAAVLGLTAPFVNWLYG